MAQWAWFSRKSVALHCPQGHWPLRPVVHCGPTVPVQHAAQPCVDHLIG
eukprot:CAMPEP_0202870926 /NCGR_PEP_ID=MMETSP1391-20130828/17208_1 /ASSEMBLY_ACC=CAM_ASM_000867 /TAXON_ID=1034604 /ORGANISM="Chlamydomonas leiostraca, Strain SAG 11-49" /LENGTH=48 /DNA_ID= /DNA_START= /DNA_END= /DNA_ORIENTATION=